MNDLTAFHSLSWCAGTIAHESWHAKLYHEGKSADPRDYEERTKEEIACIKHQIKVLRKIGAPNAEINFLKTEDGTHFDLDKVH